MNFVANEVRYVENLLEKKQLTPRKVTKELRMIAKYYLSQHDKQTSIEMLVEFMNQVSENGNRWRKTIESIVNDLIGKQDFELRDIEEIHITESELNTIKTLDSELEQRYAFGLIVYCKIWNYKKKGKFVRIESTTHFAKDCDVNAKREDREKLFHRLKTKGLVNIPRKTGSDSVEVLFVDHEGEPSLIIPIKNVEKFIYYYYDSVNKHKVKECAVCRDLILVKGKASTKYCDKCKREKELEQDRNYQKRKYLMGKDTQ